ncbi:hypothetical protein HYT23_04845 [Candidatus Pacearchaeota archaeon]|nr:hypothetical protein [Candidatus Pacearchaeota archaeon]
MSFAANIGYIILGCVAIVVVFLGILAVIEKKLLIKLLRSRTTRNELYIQKIAKINIDKPDEALSEIDKTAKSFFREAFHMEGNPEYSELENFFLKKNNRKAVGFSRIMTTYLYSGMSPEKPDLQELIKLLAEIISSNKILSKEEKAELDKKSLKKSMEKQKLAGKSSGIKSRISFLRKIK